jgi:hypothetical protein
MSKGVGLKYDTGKYRHSLLPTGVLKEVIKVLEYGATKYAPDNWKEVEDGTSRYYDAALRHIDSWYEGQKVDSETGLHHLAHATCCLMFLMWSDKNEGEGYDL